VLVTGADGGVLGGGCGCAAEDVGHAPNSIPNTTNASRMRPSTSASAAR
jgi:hypothetical protein